MKPYAIADWPGSGWWSTHLYVAVDDLHRLDAESACPRHRGATRARSQRSERVGSILGVCVSNSTLRR